MFVSEKEMNWIAQAPRFMGRKGTKNNSRKDNPFIATVDMMVQLANIAGSGHIS